LETIQNIDFTYTKNIIDILKSLGATILVSTYQTKKILLINVRGETFEMRYKNFPRPMGMYAQNGRIYAGLGHQIWQFGNYNSATQKLEESFDACYLPQNIYFTGDIDIHEMQTCGSELYFVNTRFSCLCTKDEISSFKPVWKPPFISSLQPTDKCHLNGFCARDDQPRYVTALGESDEAMGWRENKVNGGILMDIQTNEVLLRDLCMPHSPRWHQNKLWLLESGKGVLGYYDFKEKKLIELITLPGFTRGLEFIGDLAFIGLSKVRESVTFSGLPITKLPKRISGIWIVNIKTAQTVSFIEFTRGIDEIFAINVLPHARIELFNDTNELSYDNYMVAQRNKEKVSIPQTPGEFAAPHFEKGRELFETDKKAAIEAFEKAIAIQPDFLPARLNIAIALGDLERFDEAEKILLEVIEKDASIVETYNSLAYVHYKRGDLQKAKENYEKALSIEPENRQALNSLEILLKEMQKGEN
jgi:uncharacterized protein (TIGR03032 family)